MGDIDCLPAYIREKLPDPEPQPPGGHFRMQVSYPFVPLGAKESIAKVIEEGLISSATKVVRDFEDELRRYYGVPFAQACSSGYSALVLALKLSGVGAGDDVIIPAFTMVAVLNAVLTVRANPIFVDCADGQFNPSVTNYEMKLTPKSRAIIVTHTYGIPADCSGLQKLCKAKGLLFIEDIAEAIGTECNGKLVGTYGDFACASLYANKTITAGDGGFVLGSRTDVGLKDRANSYVNHGFTKAFHFVHFEPSGNYKMSGLQAAFVQPAVGKITEVMQDRNRIAKLYRKYLSGIPGLTMMPKNPYGKDAPWMFGVMVDLKQKRKTVRQKLADTGIETRDFFFPLHLQPMMLEIRPGDEVQHFPNAEMLGMTGFYLPTYYNMRSEDIIDISQCLKEAVK